jgi:hypothetical protein
VDSNQIEAMAPSSATPPRWPALTSANRGGKYAATSQKTGPARRFLVAVTRYSRNRPASTASASITVHTCTPTAFGIRATGTDRSATAGGLTKA